MNHYYRSGEFGLRSVGELPIWDSSSLVTSYRRPEGSNVEGNGWVEYFKSNVSNPAIAGIKEMVAVIEPSYSGEEVVAHFSPTKLMEVEAHLQNLKHAESTNFKKTEVKLRSFDPAGPPKSFHLSRAESAVRMEVCHENLYSEMMKVETTVESLLPKKNIPRRDQRRLYSAETSEMITEKSNHIIAQATTANGGGDNLCPGSSLAIEIGESTSLKASWAESGTPAVAQLSGTSSDEDEQDFQVTSTVNYDSSKASEQLDRSSYHGVMVDSSRAHALFHVSTEYPSEPQSVERSVRVDLERNIEQKAKLALKQVSADKHGLVSGFLELLNDAVGAMLQLPLHHSNSTMKLSVGGSEELSVEHSRNWTTDSVELGLGGYINVERVAVDGGLKMKVLQEPNEHVPYKSIDSLSLNNLKTESILAVSPIQRSKDWKTLNDYNFRVTYLKEKSSVVAFLPSETVNHTLSLSQQSVATKLVTQFLPNQVADNKLYCSRTATTRPQLLIDTLEDETKVS